jgi:hypothetical protein
VAMLRTGRQRNCGSILGIRRDFAFSTETMTVQAQAQAPNSWVPQRFLRVGARRSEREADQSPPFPTVLKNEWSFTSNPAYDCVTCTVISLPY